MSIFANSHFNPAFSDQLIKDRDQHCVSHTCGCPQSAPLHLATVVGQYPKDTITRRLRKACHFQNCREALICRREQYGSNSCTMDIIVGGFQLKWIVIFAAALLLVSIAGMNTTAQECSINSTQNLSIVGFEYRPDLSKYQQMLKDEDFTAAKTFLLSKGSSTTFENGEFVYVEEYTDGNVKVRRPGETKLWWLNSFDALACNASGMPSVIASPHNIPTKNNALTHSFIAGTSENKFILNWTDKKHYIMLEGAAHDI
jgi:hypothetical protein